jgi:peptide/nickel transport system permease protein
MLSIPILIFGTIISILISLVAANFRSGLIDKSIMAFSAIGMSISFLIIIIVFQIVFCSSYGLDIFPVQGWSVYTFGDYIYYATIPVASAIFVSLGYSTRFYRAIFVEELTRDHVRTARAYGINPWKILYKCVLKNSLIPIITRLISGIPFIIIGGSLLLETYFNIPGIGQVIYNAITTGDLPIIKAAVTYTALLYVVCLSLTDIMYKVVDPRISLK